MCVVAIAWKADPRWHLVMAGNRDEFHARPTSAAARWHDPPHVIGGRDLRSGGMWLGVSDEGRFAVVTNLAGLSDIRPDAASRGALVQDFLGLGSRPEDPARFNGFTLFTLGRDGADLTCNWPEPATTPLQPGIHCLSNGQPDAPWPRRTALGESLSAWMASGDAPAAMLARLAEEREVAPDHPPIFIRDPIYGTRASTLVLVDGDGNGQFIERSFGPDGVLTGQVEIAFRWAV